MPGIRVLEGSLVSCAPCASALVHPVLFFRLAADRLGALVLYDVVLRLFSSCRSLLFLNTYVYFFRLLRLLAHAL